MSNILQFPQKKNSDGWVNDWLGSDFTYMTTVPAEGEITSMVAIDNSIIVSIGGQLWKYDVEEDKWARIS